MNGAGSGSPPSVAPSITAGRVTDLGAERDVATFRGRTFAVLGAAHAAGIRRVDAARSYGRAEEFLAARLTALPRCARGPDRVRHEYSSVVEKCVERR